MVTLGKLVTTCTFVNRVSGVTKKPLPCAWPASIVTTAGMTRATTSSMDAGSPPTVMSGAVDAALTISVAGSVGDGPPELGGSPGPGTVSDAGGAGGGVQGSGFRIPSSGS